MALVKLLLIFVLLVFLLRRKWLMGHALLLAALLCGLFQGIAPLPTGKVVIHTLENTQNLLLACIILSILIFAHSLAKTGYVNRFIQAYQSISPWPHLNLMVIPAFIGLLPMPGGAIFSAPLVERLAADANVSRPQQAIINYWFRHCPEFCWPLYPGLILAAHLGQVDLVRLITYQFSLSILAFVLGIVFFLRGLSSSSLQARTNFFLFLREAAPILVVLVLAVSGKKLFPFLPREITIGLAVWVGIVWVWIRTRITLKQLKLVFTEKTLLKVLYAVFGIFTFKQMLNESHIVIDASKLLVNYHVPLILIAAFLPFLVGLIIGLTLAFVGTTFPLLIALIHTMHVPAFPYIVLAFIAGVIGVLLSPMHLCLVLSLEYFQVEFGGVYPRLYWPCILLFLAGFVWFFILRSIA